MVLDQQMCYHLLDSFFESWVSNWLTWYLLLLQTLYMQIETARNSKAAGTKRSIRNHLWLTCL
jgi:hypothetical protein